MKMSLLKRVAAVLVLSLLFIQPSDAKKDKLPPFKPQFGPWVTNVTETSFTVLWTTEYDALVSLEVAPGDDGSEFESDQRASFVESVAGRRITGRYHSITATGLEPGRTYRYRLVGQNVEDDSNAYGTTYGVNMGSKEPSRRSIFWSIRLMSTRTFAVSRWLTTCIMTW